MVNGGPSWKTQNFFSGEFSPQVENGFSQSWYQDDHQPKPVLTKTNT
jgi:hypothetical protein